jgi:wyosine [tRNA(Phe)-imidazoG37] synthetase (radical SAM superfamily)
MDACELYIVHDRRQANRYVYPVISRAARVSRSASTNPGKACNFDCVYCSVDRSTPGHARDVDLARLRIEPDQMLTLATSGAIFEREPLDRTPVLLRRLNDVAFSGDGEPSACPQFPQTCEMAAQPLADRGLTSSCKLVLITNATLLHRPAVADALALLDRHNGEI